MQAKLPNFFLIGAAKAGTTALWGCIGQHPDVYMCPVKEPTYFAVDGRPPLQAGPAGAHMRSMAVWRPRDYMMLFAGVRGERAVGEASVFYLRSPQAAHKIRRSLPGSRIVAILRQPAERAYSHYHYMRQFGAEPARTFPEALAHEATRVSEGWFSGLLHRGNGFYHAQIRTYFELFPSDQIRVYLYEDWSQRPDALLSDLFRFLDVDDSFRPVIERRNITVFPRHLRLHRIAASPRRLDGMLKMVPAPARRKALSGLRWLDARYNRVTPPPLDPEIRARLTHGYREDILKLQDLLGRDLSHWLAPRG